jgi:glyoxylase-like metal-dependent hydrolase (beta-lactamase superfamily II)
MLGTNDYPLFLYRSEDEAAFFEGGTGAMGPLLLQQLQELGIPKDLIKQLVVTHAHPDHVMAIPFLRKMIDHRFFPELWEVRTHL